MQRLFSCPDQGTVALDNIIVFAYLLTYLQPSLDTPTNTMIDWLKVFHVEEIVWQQSVSWAYHGQNTHQNTSSLAAY